jgi:Putative amidase domain
VPLTRSLYRPRSRRPGWRTAAAAALALAALGAGGAYVGQPEHHSSTAVRPAADTAAQSPNRYDAAGAAAWAMNNVHSGDYYRDDCTNFVSSAMWAGGGLPFYTDDNNADHHDDRNWYMVSDGTAQGSTDSWDNAGHLDHFLHLRGLGHQVSLADAKPGDVIFVNWGPGGRDTPDNNPSGEAGVSHVGMVVENPGHAGGDRVRIAQHSSDTIETLADWRRPNPNLQVWVYSISLG